jgi:predicted nucleic acid-binding protein
VIHLVDSNVYIHAFRDAAFGEWLRQFHKSHLPQLVLSAVVVHELVVGAADKTKVKSLQRGLIAPFRARRRVHAPGSQTWEMAADVDLRLRVQTNLQTKLKTRSFANDLLIAASARELGAVIVTENSSDFSLIASVLDIRFLAPVSLL